MLVFRQNISDYLFGSQVGQVFHPTKTLICADPFLFNTICIFSFSFDRLEERRFEELVEYVFISKRKWKEYFNGTVRCT